MHFATRTSQLEKWEFPDWPTLADFSASADGCACVIAEMAMMQETFHTEVWRRCTCAVCFACVYSQRGLLQASTTESGHSPPCPNVALGVTVTVTVTLKRVNSFIPPKDEAASPLLLPRTTMGLQRGLLVLVRGRWRAVKVCHRVSCRAAESGGRGKTAVTPSMGKEKGELRQGTTTRGSPRHHKPQNHTKTCSTRLKMAQKPAKRGSKSHRNVVPSTEASESSDGPAPHPQRAGAGHGALAPRGWAAGVGWPGGGGLRPT